MDFPNDVGKVIISYFEPLSRLSPRSSDFSLGEKTSNWLKTALAILEGEKVTHKRHEMDLIYEAPLKSSLRFAHRRGKKWNKKDLFSSRVTSE